LKHSNVVIYKPDVMRVKKHWNTKFSVNCVTCTPSPCVFFQFVFTDQESKESWERTSMKYHILGNFGDHFNLAIWRFRSQSPNYKVANNEIPKPARYMCGA